MKSQIILHCDACHQELGVETLTEDDIDRPCPRCGASLLTKEDYANWKVVRSAMEFAKSLGLIADGPEPDTTQVKMKFVSKDGDLTICQPEPVEATDEV